jgi:hypothetical protein
MPVIDMNAINEFMGGEILICKLSKDYNFKLNRFIPEPNDRLQDSRELCLGCSGRLAITFGLNSKIKQIKKAGKKVLLICPLCMIKLLKNPRVVLPFES